MFNRINSNDIAQIRWLKCWNSSNETAPAFGVAKANNVTSDGVSIAKPNSYSDRYAVVVGPQDIPKGSYGICTFDDNVRALPSPYGATTSLGSLLGTVPGSWMLHPQRSGFIRVGTYPGLIVSRQKSPCFTGIRGYDLGFGGSLPNGIWTKIATYTTDYHFSYDGPCFGSLGTYGLQILRAGFYTVGFQCAFPGVIGATGLRGIQIDLNSTGSVVTAVAYRIETALPHPYTTSIQATGSFRVPRDYEIVGLGLYNYAIRIQAYQESGGTLLPSAAQSHFWIHRHSSTADPNYSPTNPTWPV